MVVNAFGYLQSDEVSKVSKFGKPVPLHQTEHVIPDLRGNYKFLLLFKVRGQVEKCLEPVRLCNYACEIENDMCQGNLSL